MCCKNKDVDLILIRVSTQMTIDEKESRLAKRYTIDCASFPPSSGKSINRRLIRQNLILRILSPPYRPSHSHPSIHTPQYYNPSYEIRSGFSLSEVTRISKNRCSGAGICIATCTIRSRGDYSIISETVFGLTNDIHRDEAWSHNTLHSPLQTELDSPRRWGEDNALFCQPDNYLSSPSTAQQDSTATSMISLPSL